MTQDHELKKLAEFISMEVGDTGASPRQIADLVLRLGYTRASESPQAEPKVRRLSSDRILMCIDGFWPEEPKFSMGEYKKQLVKAIIQAYNSGELWEDTK